MARSVVVIYYWRLKPVYVRTVSLLFPRPLRHTVYINSKFYCTILQQILTAYIFELFQTQKKSAFKNPSTCLKQTNYSNGQNVLNDWTTARVTLGYGGDKGKT